MREVILFLVALEADGAITPNVVETAHPDVTEVIRSVLGDFPLTGRLNCPGTVWRNIAPDQRIPLYEIVLFDFFVDADLFVKMLVKASDELTDSSRSHIPRLLCPSSRSKGRTLYHDP